MTEELNAFDDNSIRKLQADHRRLQHQIRNLIRQEPGRNWDSQFGRELRSGVTCTTTRFPLYPEPPANTFCVQFSDDRYDLEPGVRAITRKEWKQKVVMARTLGGGWLAKGTQVHLVKLPGLRGSFWYILEGPAEFVSFTLLENRWSKTQQGHKARIDSWWSSLENIGPAAMSTTQTNSSEDFRIWFNADSFPRALNGATGMAVYDATSKKYWAIQCDQMSTRMFAETTAAVCPETSSFNVRNGQAMDFWPFSQLPPTGRTISGVRNFYHLACMGSANAQVEWVEDGEYWLGVQFEHYPTDIMVDLKYTTGYNASSGQNECKLEKGLRKKCAVMRCSEKIDYETAVPLYRNVFLTDIRQQHIEGDGSDPDYCILQAKEKTSCGFDSFEDQEGSWQNFVTYTKDQVLVNVYDDGTEIKGTLIDVWAPCWGDEYDVSILTPETCPEES